ncbi:hypothetical protein [Janibacter sp. G1551]|uniref:hypothetical protein n=1 Tax=Janibacter sp. G1551 TaxID=3420440 RepID=UPI003CFF73B9
MNTPFRVGPSSPDDDPTGMRDLLRHLPDPGPMPDDLVARIRASLAEEASRPVTAPGVVDLVAERSRRRWVLPAAAAAALIALGGTALLNLQGPSGGADSAAVSRAVPESGAAADDAGTDAGSGTSDGATSGNATPDTARAAFVLTMSERTFDPGRVASYVAAGSDDLSELTSSATEAPGIGPIGTPLGASDCLERLGIDPLGGLWVDLGTVDGAPAALIVTRGDAPVRSIGVLVTRDCTALSDVAEGS